jgi:hypothetical protein
VSNPISPHCCITDGIEDDSDAEGGDEYEVDKMFLKMRERNRQRRITQAASKE